MFFIGAFIFVVILVVVFGRSKEWEYEAKLIVEGDYKVVGEIEIEKFKKEKPFGELALYEEKLRKPGTFEIRVEDKLISRLRWNETGNDLSTDYPSPATNPKDKKKTKRLGHKFVFPLDENLKVHKDETVVVWLPNGKRLRGVFVRD